MPLEPHEWPFKLQKWAFRAFKPRTLKAQSLRGFSLPEIEEMRSVKLLPYSEHKSRVPTINTKIFAIQKKILRGINFVKITKKKFQPPPKRNKKNHTWELQENSVAATNSRKNYQKNTKKKTPRGELICKNFGVNGLTYDKSRMVLKLYEKLRVV